MDGLFGFELACHNEDYEIGLEEKGRWRKESVLAQIICRFGDIRGCGASRAVMLVNLAGASK